MEGGVLVEEGEAGIAFDFGEVVVELGTASHEGVETFVAEADTGIVGNGAAVIDFADVSPEAGAEAHGAGLAGSVEFAAREVVGMETACGLSDSDNLAV